MAAPTLRLLPAALAAALALLPAPGPAPAHDALPLHADSEASRTPPPAAVQWRLEAADPAALAQVRYPELALERLVALDEANRSRAALAPAPLGIGVGRRAPSAAAAQADLAWRPLPGGGRAATLAVTSPVAMGLRVGLAVEGLPAGAELRVRGSERPLGPIVLAGAAEVSAATRAGGLYWTPATDGQTQTIEIFVPAGASVDGLRVSAPELSHLVTNGRRNFKILEKIGESESCNIDTACRVDALDWNFGAAKNAVAHMVFNVYNTDGSVYGSYLCTGTLLADTDPATQVPLFYSARHCFVGGAGGVPVQDPHKVAASLTTYWNYEATACGGNVSAPQTTLGGGADVLLIDENTDAMLLRLRSPAPAVATFAGWDASAMPANADVVAIHHPYGDAKKVSFGRHIPGQSDAVNHAAGWLEGTTEQGSSGSGLFTVAGDGRYRLRGGLYGGYASCASSGDLGNPQNLDWYSRLDVVFPQIRQYLVPVAPPPRRRNGSLPLAPR